MKNLCILIFGAPGSGKGTISSIISKAVGGISVSTGEIVRNSSDDEVKQSAANGDYLPDNVMIRLLEEYWAANHVPSDAVIFLDGFPRTDSQLSYICEKFRVLFAFHCMVPFDVIKKRLGERLLKENRADDDQEIIKKRFEVYTKDTQSIIERFSDFRIPVKVIDNSKDLIDVLIKTLIDLKDMLKAT